MKDRKQIRMVIESLKWNIASWRNLGAEDSPEVIAMKTAIRSLGWVLEDEDIRLSIPKHYETTGSHAMPTERESKYAWSKTKHKHYDEICEELKSG